MASCNFFSNWFFRKSDEVIKPTVNENNDDKEPYIDPNKQENLEEEEELNPVPGEIYLSSITIVPPSKLEYEMGEEIDFSDLVVTAHFSNNTSENVSLSNVIISKCNTYKLGEQTVNVKYQSKFASFTVNIVRTYTETVDSLDGVDSTDLSDLFNSFSGHYLNYTSKTISYFNHIGVRDYYRHYQKNYVQAKNNLITSSCFFNYPFLDEYLGIMNKGYLNKDNNVYCFSLNGDTNEERLSSQLTTEQLSLIKENGIYQDDLFTIDDLSESYFISNSFKRVSGNKYEGKGEQVFKDFIDICAPGLINEGSYMTFSKVTIELDVSVEIKYRIRLYASPSQIGKIIDENLEQTEKPNWYLLFSEALVSNVGTTTFAPAESLLS